MWTALAMIASALLNKNGSGSWNRIQNGMSVYNSGKSLWQKYNN